MPPAYLWPAHPVRLNCAYGHRIFADTALAGLYDLMAPWGEPDDAFYIDLVMAADSVLDVGCGTGLLLREARRAGHSGRLVGLDPAEAMLDVARRDPANIEWITGDLSTVRWDREFDLIVMTGHAFQVFVEDDLIRSSLASIRSALSDNGHFAFETRNPLVRTWEAWTPDNVAEIITPTGDVVHFSREIERPVEGDIVRFTATFSSPAWDEPKLSRSVLRFLDAASLASFLAEAGLEIIDRYGDWDRSPLTTSSPEIITIARIPGSSIVPVLASRGTTDLLAHHCGMDKTRSLVPRDDNQDTFESPGK